LGEPSKYATSERQWPTVSVVGMTTEPDLSRKCTDKFLLQSAEISTDELQHEPFPKDIVSYFSSKFFLEEKGALSSNKSVLLAE